MRYFGHSNTPHAPVPSDATTVFLLAANAAQSAAFPEKADFARVSFASTAGAALAGCINFNSTSAAWGASHSSTVGTTGSDSYVPAGIDRVFQLPRGITTGTSFSVIAPAAGVCCVEFWSRGGST